MSMVLLLFAGAGQAQQSFAVVDTHDGFGRAMVHKERRITREEDDSRAIADEIRNLIAPKVAKPKPVSSPAFAVAAAIYDDEEEALLCLSMI